MHGIIGIRGVNRAPLIHELGVRISPLSKNVDFAAHTKPASLINFHLTVSVSTVDTFSFF